MAALGLLGAGLLATGIGSIAGVFVKKQANRAVNTLYVDTSASVSYTQSIVQNNSSTIGQSVSNMNQLTLNIKNVSTDTLKILQSIDSSVQATGQISASILSQLNTALISNLTAAVSQAANAQSGFFGTRAADAENRQTYINAVTQSVNKYTQQDNYNSIVSTVFNTNTLTLTLDNVNTKDLEIKQQIVSRLIAKTLVNAIINDTNNILTQSSSNLQVSQDATAVSGINSKDIVTSLIVCTVSFFISLLMLLMIFMLRRQSKQN